MSYLCTSVCVCLPYVCPCVSFQVEFIVHPHVSSSVIYLCATSFVYKSSQSSLWCLGFGDWWKVSAFMPLWLIYFFDEQSRLDPLFCLLYLQYSARSVCVPNSSEKVYSKPQTRVKDSQCRQERWEALSRERVSVSLCFSFSQNIMEWLIQVVFSE